MHILRNITVYKIGSDGNRKTYNELNELEFVNGKLFSNVWGTDNILLINPTTGEVEKVIDFSRLTLFEKTEKGIRNQGNDVLNGIAYDKFTNRYF
jgi:glutamine cyclotransferase